MSIYYRGPSIDASYQVSIHLAEGFQRRRLKCEKLTDDGRKVIAKAHFAFGKVSEKFEFNFNSAGPFWPFILEHIKYKPNLFENSMQEISKGI